MEFQGFPGVVAEGNGKVTIRLNMRNTRVLKVLKSSNFPFKQLYQVWTSDNLQNSNNTLIVNLENFRVTVFIEFSQGMNQPVPILDKQSGSTRLTELQ
jgi:hypothetical protein